MRRMGTTVFGRVSRGAAGNSVTKSDSSNAPYLIDRESAAFNARQELRLIQQHQPRYILVPVAPKQSCQFPGTFHSNFVYRDMHTKFPDRT